ncbi:MAG: transcriptional regulator [Altererythrobacter sp. XM-24bin4]|uniref:winged helix DNA-binding protein n=1 Tax=uncultured Altererythrobacter sp. TaxID=500840 RepID=UPI000D791272|nr:winged helix DNA-binding protein [uncultured Altererythrobacter sp.]PWL25483.1 MAG: transcriptional regulator [Altererythrobacter sp. XM-24bin4]
MEATYYRDWHLAKDDTEFRITELEFAMLRALEAFVRWVASADEIVGLSELKHSEHLILHVIRMQNRPKSGATIARLLNRDDLPNIQYSLRKLESSGYIKKLKEEGTKNHNYSVTQVGKKLTDDYAELRREIFIKQLKNIADFDTRVEDATNLLSLLTGIYEECSRTSSTLNRLNRSNRQS